MRFQHHYTVPAPLDQAVSAHRDDVEHYGHRFPGISRVELAADGTQHWQGDTSVLPVPLRPFVAERFRWRIRTRWSERRCDWALAVPVLGESPLIEGRYDFSPHGSETEVALTAALAWSDDAASRLGVSSWQRWLLPMLEQFVGTLFTTVLGRSSEVLREHVAGRALAA